MTDKIIVTNALALKSKYGADGLKLIQAAIKKLIAADKERNIKTRLVALNDEKTMKSFKASPVTNAADTQQNKAAIDSIFAASRPDYLMILGSIDVIPHQDLKNPAFGGEDLDVFAFGDLPYACEAPYSQDVHDFIGVTRVVGRLPDLTGKGDPSYLTGLLEVATKWKATAPDNYLQYFGISADQWKGSTSLSIASVFGSSNDLKLSPKNGPQWNKALLARKSHFINCHGNPASFQFYGQKGQSYPVSYDAKLLEGAITEGTVAAVECCYGAELYNPDLAGGQKGICSTYLENKAYGFFGSTTIAYGPPDVNGAADLICQSFLKRVLAGASIGRAALEARQRFIESATALDPFDLKTLAQFNLYGDPSVNPVDVPTPHDTVVTAKTAMKRTPLFCSQDIAERRHQLLLKGNFLEQTCTFSRKSRKKPRPSIITALNKIANRIKMKHSVTMSFTIQTPSAPKGMLSKSMVLAKAKTKLGSSGNFHVMFGRKATRQTPVPRIVAVVAKEVEGKIVSYRQLIGK